MSIALVIVMEKRLYWSSCIAFLSRLDKKRAVNIYAFAASAQIKEALLRLEIDRSYVPRPVLDGLLRLIRLVEEEKFEAKLRDSFLLLQENLRTLNRLKVGEKKIGGWIWASCFTNS